MTGLIAGFPHDGIVTVNRAILRDEYSTMTCRSVSPSSVRM